MTAASTVIIPSFIASLQCSLTSSGVEGCDLSCSSMIFMLSSNWTLPTSAFTLRMPATNFGSWSSMVRPQVCATSALFFTPLLPQPPAWNSMPRYYLSLSRPVSFRQTFFHCSPGTCWLKWGRVALEISIPLLYLPTVHEEICWRALQCSARCP